MKCLIACVFFIFLPCNVPQIPIYFILPGKSKGKHWKLLSQFLYFLKRTGQYCFSEEVMSFERKLRLSDAFIRHTLAPHPFLKEIDLKVRNDGRSFLFSMNFALEFICSRFQFINNCFFKVGLFNYLESKAWYWWEIHS